MATVQVGDAATHNEKEVMTRYPVDEGLTLGTTKIENKEPYLKPEDRSLVKEKDSCGIY